MNKIHLRWLFLSSGLLPLMGLAAPVTPEEAMSEATNFRALHYKMFRAAPAAGSPEVAYVGKSKGYDCFYVVNYPGGTGSAIVTADDRLPRIIGFTDNGSFAYDMAPDNMKWWLEQYSMEIADYLLSAPAESTVVISHKRKEDYTPVEPLLTTTWDQGAPYNDRCPTDPRTGRRSVTGCVATAMAQVMKYHQYPDHPTGMNAGEVFEGTTLDWTNMLDSYQDGQYTVTQSAAVALLMRQCGASVNMQYSSMESGAYSNDVPVALRTYFGYNASMSMHWRDYYKMSDWIEMVYSELAASRPVYYTGRSDRGGHAFVCDGYMGSNYFHFNWGWGGYQDGYFMLNALNPETGGTGSYAGGYNRDQSIICGVRPSQGETQIQYLLLATGDFWYAGDNTYEIRNGSDGQNLIYNPLAYRQQVSFGLKVTDMSDPTKVYYSSRSGSQGLDSYQGIRTLTSALPGGLADGMYKVTPAMYTQTGEWVDIMVPYSAQRWVTLTVSGGRTTLTNEGSLSEAGAHLIVGLPQMPEPLYGNAGKAMRLQFINTGEEDYAATIYLSLYHDEDVSATSLDMPKSIFVPAESSIEVEFSSNEPLDPGPYTAIITFKNSLDLIDSRRVTVIEGDFGAYSTTDVELEEMVPAFHSADEPYGLTATITNYGKNDTTVEPSLKILNASTLEQVGDTYRFGAITFPKGESINLGFPPLDIDLPPGRYLWVLTDASGGILGNPQPLCVERGPVSAEGISYIITSDAQRTARLVVPLYEEYRGTLEVPEYISGYQINDMSADVFTFADELHSVTLPKGIKEIPPGSFYNARALESLTLLSPEPPLLWPEAFRADAPASILLSTADGCANLYHSWDVWSEFDMSAWDIHIGEGCHIKAGLETDPVTGTYYAPYYVSAFERLKLEVEVPEGYAVNAEWRIDGSSLHSEDTDGKVVLPALEGKQGELWLKLTDGSGIAEVIGSEAPVDVYNTLGILLKSNATVEDINNLPKGIYIVAGKKIYVK